MAQLYFKFGAMGSSKSANALMARFNYEERGQDTLLVKPQLDTRDGDHMVRSRIGLEHPLEPRQSQGAAQHQQPRKQSRGKPCLFHNRKSPPNNDQPAVFSCISASFV